jgi:subtilase family serine protease
MTTRPRRPLKPTTPAGGPSSFFQPLESRQLLSVTLPTASPELVSTPLATSSTVVGLTPAQLKTAYGYSSLSFSSGKTAAVGTGQTIAIVDAYNDPDIASNLATFDGQFGLAAASLSVVNQTGGTALPQSNADWSEEISLDVEWAHAVAPGAKILLVEASSSSDSDLLTAVKYARSAGGVSVVSMSWGGSEFSGQTAYDSYFTTPSGHTGVTFIASSGDSGSSDGVDWPASSPDVLSVGGTTLLTSGTSGTYSSETGWADSGGGASAYEGEPSYQTTAQSKDVRTVPDVSADANPETGVAVYDSYGTSSSWLEFGGTSAAAPQWAGLVAIADQGRVISGLSELDGATNLLPTIYSLASSSGTYSADFHDVTSGSTSRSISAGTGYDEVTGLGTPKANTLVPALVASTKKVTLTTTTVPTTTTNRPPPPPPWWMAVTAPATVSSVLPSSTNPIAVNTAAPAAVSAGNLAITTTATPAAASAGTVAGVDNATASLPASTGARATADATAGTLDYQIPTGASPALTSDATTAMGLVGTNILTTTAGAATSELESATSFATTLAAGSWPAGTTELRVAAASFAQTLAANANAAVKPVAAAAAAAGILYAVAGQSRRSKKVSPLFSDRTIRIA